MKKYRISISTIIIAQLMAGLSGTHGLHAQENTSRRVIAYTDFVDKIKEALPQIRKNRIAVKRAENAALAGKGIFDTNIEASASWNKTWKYSYNPFSRTGYETDYAGSWGLTKKFFSTGTTISGGISYQQYQSDIDYGSIAIPDTYHYPAYYVGFSQSLLKNSFGVVDRFALKDAEMKKEIEILRAAHNDDSALNYYRKLYFDWIESGFRIELLKKTIIDAAALRNRVIRKFQLGLAENDEVQNATAAEIQYRLAFEEETSSMKSLMEEIGLFIDTITLSPEEKELENILKQCDDYSFAETPFESTRLSSIYHLTKENYRYAEKVAGNKLLPQLDISGTITRKAQDTAFPDAAKHINDTDYYVGISASFPLENSAAESEKKNASLAVEEINHEYAIALNDYTKNIASLRNNAKAVRKMIALSENRVKALESKYRTEEKKYLQARLDLTFLITTAQTLTAEKMNLLRLKKMLIYHFIDHQDLTRKK